MSDIVLPDGMHALMCMYWPEDADADGEEMPDLGLCCACDQRRARAIAMVNRRCLIPGQGWGCLQCSLPPSGLNVVLCLECLEQEEPVVYGCAGYAASSDRVPIEEFQEPFNHDLSRHPELQRS